MIPPDHATLALLQLAAAVATGREDVLGQASTGALAASVPPAWVDELLLQSQLMVGYPRALVAFGVWRQVAGIAAPPEGERYADWAAWAERGEAACRVVYGANYERLRINVAALHPALDAWMLVEGYGRTLARPGLDLARRELCTVAQLVVLGAPRQLHSHLRGARHAGASDQAIGAALAAGTALATAENAAAAQALWAALHEGS